MNGKHLDLRVDEAGAEITLSRPEKRNAVGTALLHELAEALERIRADGDIRVVRRGPGAGPTPSSPPSRYSRLPGPGPNA